MKILNKISQKIKNIAQTLISKIIPKKKKKSLGQPTPPIPSTPPILSVPEEAPEISENFFAKEKIDELIDKIKEMDSEGYVPEFSHSWSMNPSKAPNSNGAGIAKESSGNAIIDVIRDEVNVHGYTAIAMALEKHWDEIIYQIERLEYAIYDSQYRKKSGGRAAYEAGLLKLRRLLTGELY